MDHAFVATLARNVIERLSQAHKNPMNFIERKFIQNLTAGIANDPEGMTKALDDALGEHGLRLVPNDSP